MTFEWHEGKNSANSSKHGVWFEEAQTVWADPGSIEFHDPEHSAEEERFIRVGYSSASRILLVVFCEREQGGVIRIIGARKATPRERKQYEEGIRS
ncbi:MAG: BrnT family toxin [Acidobacteriia bacterium]|nr:BrnT family toxin [Terriglobia bacterium]